MKIISGGQTGVDRAALDAALELGLPCGGWCPKGRRAEDGRLPEKYPLKETDSEDYAVRTELNVRDSDGTLIITRGKPKGGTAYTIACCRIQGKPFLAVDLEERPSHHPSPQGGEGGRRPGEGVIIGQVLHWLASHNIRTLNIAGPRESTSVGIYKTARQILLEVLQ